MIDWILQAISIGAWSFMFTEVYQQPGEVFYWVRKYAMNQIDPGYKERGQAIPDTRREGKRFFQWWEWKALTCGKCHAFYASIGYLACVQPVVRIEDIFIFVAVASFTAYAIQGRYG